MNTADVQAIMYDFLLVFSAFFVTFGGIYFFFLIARRFIENAFK
jgi:hypothetical protein